MAVFKLLGTLVQVLEGGREKVYETKMYVRASTEVEAYGKATELGFTRVHASFFCRDNVNPLGDNKYYAADNNRGVMNGF